MKDVSNQIKRPHEIYVPYGLYVPVPPPTGCPAGKGVLYIRIIQSREGLQPATLLRRSAIGEVLMLLQKVMVLMLTPPGLNLLPDLFVK